MTSLSSPEIKYSTFHTLNLSKLATMIYEEGWDSVRGTIYRHNLKGIEANLVMFDDHYALVASPRGRPLEEGGPRAARTSVPQHGNASFPI